MKKVKEKLKGKATIKLMSNDLFWDCCISDTSNIKKMEFFHIKWYGYNDAYWWNNVAESKRVSKCVGSLGTTKYFKIDFHTLEVEEVEEG